MGKAHVTFLLALALASLGASEAQALKADEVVVVCPQDASFLERLAAQEVRRYLYVRTGERVRIVGERPAGGCAVVVARQDRGLISGVDVALEPEDYLLRTKGRDLIVAGGSDVGTLYGAYRLAEHLGVRFYMHGDVVPDARVPLEWPELDEHGAPLFNLRGIQPFHDFPEGPDWWSTDDYKAILGQLPKMRMNFFGLHTYPENRPNAEPTVWIGRPEDVNDDGTVRHSYPVLYYTTALIAGWGFNAKKTSDYVLGAGMMYDRDGFGSDVMRGLGPRAEGLETGIELFNRTGAMFNDAFTFAHRLGVKTCVGTETPLVVPQRVAGRGGGPEKAGVQDLYEGIFTRIMRTYPIDYYWFWTPEGWTWQGVEKDVVQKTIDDVLAAAAAAKKLGAPFRLATCGWVLGPQYDRALFDKALPKDVAVSCISRSVGHEPVEPGFADVEGRPKWAIPWLEDDPAQNSPQLWAGRMRLDAHDALAYGCTGLMGIHWRTRVLGPNIAALAHAAWDQTGWTRSEPEDEGGVVGGQVANFASAEIADTKDDPLYQTVRYKMSAYRVPVPNATYRVTLHFCEPHYKEAGKRVFGVKLEGRTVIETLDMFASVGRNRALDYAFEDIKVEDGMLDVDFIKQVEYPCMAAFAIEGDGFDRKVNCGGPAYQDYLEDLATLSPHKPAGDFYDDWALSQFGPEVAEDAARIFENVDGRLPRPSDWVNGPGGYRPDGRSWAKVSGDYAYVDAFAALRPRVAGAGHLERFDYWLGQFRFMRATKRMCCVWHRFNQAMKQAKAEEDPEKAAALARETALPLRKELVAVVCEAYRELLATVNTWGAMGSVTNLEQHTFADLLEKPGRELAKILGEPLPADALPPRDYDGPTRVFVPTIRTGLVDGEELDLKVIVLSKAPPRSVRVHWRPMGQGDYRQAPVTHAARGWYRAALAAADDFEYYIEVAPVEGDAVYWPATAPDLNQTVVVTPAS